MPPDLMNAMLLETVGQPLRHSQIARPQPAADQILVKVEACGVCRTDLHVCDGDLTDPALPLVPGHEVVGRVAGTGERVEGFVEGQRVGVPWLGWTCGSCEACRRGDENLCDLARFTGYSLNGGYAEFLVADQRYCFPIAADIDAWHAAPLLCAGLIGYRSLRMAGDAHRLGLYGFGAAAHIVTQVARHQGREVYAFVRPGDQAAEDFARSLGAIWTGESTSPPPEELDAAILYAPVGALIPIALAAVRPGGTVVCAGIHMSEIPAFPYELLWRERRLVSVANLTRADGEAFLALAPTIPVRTTIETFPLNRANEALDRLRSGALSGAAVLVP